MFEYVVDVDLARLAVITGLFLTVLFFDRLKIAPGGMVVPGYIVLYLNHPDQIFFTFLLAFLVYIFVSRFLMNRMILYGRRRFSVTILTGAVFSIILESFMYSTSNIQPFIGFKLIGIIIPGLIANEMLREQNKVFVLSSIGLVTTLTFGFVWSVSQIKWAVNTGNTDVSLLILFTGGLILSALVSFYLLFYFKWEKHFHIEQNRRIG